MQSYNIQKLSILVLEKHLLIRNLLTEVFREFGVPTVQSTCDPEVAGSMFQQFPVDLILSDWRRRISQAGRLTAGSFSIQTSWIATLPERPRRLTSRPRSGTGRCVASGRGLLVGPRFTL